MVNDFGVIGTGEKKYIPDTSNNPAFVFDRTNTALGIGTIAPAAGIGISIGSSTGLVPVVFAAAGESIAAGTGGALSITKYYSKISTDAGGDAFTLANGTLIGQLKKVHLIVDGGGDGVLTPASLSGGTTITFADAGDFALLIWNGTAWVAIELGNDADGATAPVLA